MKDVNIVLITSVKGSSFVLLVYVSQNHFVGVPGQCLLRYTAFDSPWNSSFICIENINAIGITRSCYIFSIITHWNSFEWAIRFVMIYLLTYNIWNTMKFNNRIFRWCCKLLIVFWKTYICYSGTVSYYWIWEKFKCGTVK